jgi:hypothetical protein
MPTPVRRTTTGHAIPKKTERLRERPKKLSPTPLTGTPVQSQDAKAAKEASAEATADGMNRREADPLR